MVLSNSLSYNQIAVIIAWGTFLWAVGVFKIRYLGHLLYVTSGRRILTFLLTIPTAYVLVLLTVQLVGASAKQRSTVSTIAASTTLVLDGIAMALFPSVYENQSVKKTNPRLATVLSRVGAGWLLYGTGLCTAFGLLTH